MPRTTPQPSSPRTPLTAAQLELLKLFSTEMTAVDLLELKRVLARHFGDKAIAQADRVWDERGLTDQDMEAWLHG